MQEEKIKFQVMMDKKAIIADSWTPSLHYDDEKESHYHEANWKNKKAHGLANSKQDKSSLFSILFQFRQYSI